MTLNQSLKKRNKKQKTERHKKLNGNPQKKGICISTFTLKPKKPNSALRKSCKVGLYGASAVNAYIPGENTDIQEHAILLVKGGNVPDLPGINLKVIRGKYNSNFVPNRRKSRSKYGTPHPTLHRK